MLETKRRDIKTQKSMEVKITRSNNRRKTISARVIGEIMDVHAPADFPQEELEEIIARFRKRFEKRQQKRQLNLQMNLRDVAQNLNQKYFGEKIEIESIEYSTNQDRIFGICNHRTKVIRISHRLASMPDWVRDYVIVHELAHIIEPNHSESFWKLVYRYELTERARGYLMAKGFQAEEETDLEEK